MSHKWNKKTDANQKQIVHDLIAFGASVTDASSIGQGFPDLVVGWNGQNYLMEVKKPVTETRSTTLNERQKRWHDSWKGLSHIVTSSQEAIDILKA